MSTDLGAESRAAVTRAAGQSRVAEKRHQDCTSADTPFVKKILRPPATGGVSIVERIRDALLYIGPTGRDDWIRVGMAIKAELGDGGFELWNEWSQGASNYDAADAKRTWRSFKRSSGVGIATVFYMARERGWRDSAEHSKPSPVELAERKRKTEERSRREEVKLASEREAAARKAAAVWNAASEARGDHPYLERKRVGPVATLRELDAHRVAEIIGYGPSAKGEPLKGRLLIVPIKVDDRLTSVEFIDVDGRKTALANGVKTGGYWATGQLPEGDGDGVMLAIGEGTATVLSASMATGHVTVAALSDTNLKSVALALRARYPKADLTILADLVKGTGEPDRHAVEAARAAGGRLAIPDFGDDRPKDAKDFNDLMTERGEEAVKRAIAGAKLMEGVEPHPGEENRATGFYAREATMVRGDGIKLVPVTWLWDGWLAAGKLHILGGAPGTGKTTLALALAATVSAGGRWPDGTMAQAGRVAVWSGEDSLADTLVPRLIAAGADLRRVHFVDGVIEGSERVPFDPAYDMPALERALAEIGDVRLLILDPIVSAVAGDSHKNAETRRGLQPVVDLAEQTGCAVLGITHFSKGTSGREPLERLTGSLAFGALARVVMVAAKHREEGEDGRTVRLFCRAKSNIGPDSGGFEYDLHQAELPGHQGITASSVLWGDAVEGAARELLAEAEAVDEEGNTLSSASRFLAGLLSDGPMRAADVFKDAEQAGFSKRSIQRAANSLNVDRRKEGMRGGWIWNLPQRVTKGTNKNFLASTSSSVFSLASSVAPSVTELASSVTELASSVAPSVIEVEI